MNNSKQKRKKIIEIPSGVDSFSNHHILKGLNATVIISKVKEKMIIQNIRMLINKCVLSK